MQPVLFIADDFGLNEAVNLAILQAHQHGALTGASLMLGQAGTAHAVALARAHPTLQIGWHLHLCDSRPVTCARWPWGDTPLRAGFLLGATAAHRRFVAAEIAAQWQLFQATGLRLEFVNAHHHLHVHPIVLRALRRTLPAAFDGWVRGFGVRGFGSPSSTGAPVCNRLGGLAPKRPVTNRRSTSFAALLAQLAGPLARRALARSGFRTSQTLWGLDRLFAMQAREVRAAMAKLPAGLHEFVFHPRGGAGDADLAALLELRSPLTARPE
jgi:hypothetical protein